MIRPAHVLVSLLVTLAVFSFPAGATAPARCIIDSGVCSFSCHAGDVLGASSFPTSGGTPQATATCGGATAACSGGLDCLAEAPGAVLRDDVGTCTAPQGAAADCFALSAPVAFQCGSSTAYDACTFSCGAGAKLVVGATSTFSGGYPRVLSVCGGSALGCQAYLSCEATGLSSQDGSGICLSRTVSTSIQCTSEPTQQRCAVNGGTCAFACHAGDVLGASAFEAGDMTPGATASCGGATASCAAYEDCLGVAPSVVQRDAVGTCQAARGKMVADCFSLAPPQGASSCGTNVAYDACTFACTANAVLDAQATDTQGGGYPRVLSECGGAKADCQAPSSCESLAQAARAGVGICLSRTIATIIRCSAISVPANAPTRCQSDASYCFVSCKTGDALGASAWEAGSSDPGALSVCGGVTASCTGYGDCLGEADASALRSGVGLCKARGPAMVADCFSLAPPPLGTPACGTPIAYAACAYTCTAGDTLDAAAVSVPGLSGSIVGYPRVLSVCGGGAAGCQAASACYGNGRAGHDGVGICLSRTVQTVIACASELA